MAAAEIQARLTQPYRPRKLQRDRRDAHCGEKARMRR